MGNHGGLRLADRERHTVTALPPWANSRVARALLDAIVADPPETYARKGNAFGPADARFSASSDSGKLFCRLRRIYREWLEVQLRALDTRFRVTGKWDADGARALQRTEDAEALVRRLIGEAGDKREAA